MLKAKQSGVFPDLEGKERRESKNLDLCGFFFYFFGSDWGRFHRRVLSLNYKTRKVFILKPTSCRWLCLHYDLVHGYARI